MDNINSQTALECAGRNIKVSNAKLKLLKILVSILLVILLTLSPFIYAFFYCITIPPQFSNTYLAGLSLKYRRLESVNEPKIILVGGSNLAFGIDTPLLERHLNMPVVNFGLYAAIGTKHMLDLSKVNINDGDIVIVIPEINKQTYSLYTNPDVMLQALDCNFGMIKNITLSDWPSLIGAFPKYLSDIKKYSQEQGLNITGAYSYDSFNEYGDIVYDRPYNTMLNMFDANGLIEINASIIDDDFIDYINNYAGYVRKNGAQVCFSFPPMNILGLTESTTESSIFDFYGVLENNLKMDIVSDINDYLIHQDYFFDSNFHMNNSGVVLRSARLIEDIKRFMGNTTETNIDIPEGGGSQPENNDVNDGEENDEVNAKLFTYTINNGKVSITGLTAAANGKTKIEIPAVIESASVKIVSNNTFSGNLSLREIIVPKSVSYIEDGAFNNCNSLLKVVLKHTDPSTISASDTILNGAHKDCKIYVPSEAYGKFVTDYFWSIRHSVLVSYNN